MTLLPNIRAHVVDRFIFNFRFPIDALERILPSWLVPHSFGGFAVASFCVLDLDRVTFGPMPDKLGLRNINCALRFAVRSREADEPAVYVTERNTNSRIGAFISTLGFPGGHKLVQASIASESNGWKIRISETERILFSADVSRAPGFISTLFLSSQNFASLMSAGVRSYCPATKEGQLNIVDLHKDETTYEPLRVENLKHDLFSKWSIRDSEVSFDCAVRTENSNYVWEYCGQRSQGE